MRGLDVEYAFDKASWYVSSVHRRAAHFFVYRCIGCVMFGMRVISSIGIEQKRGKSKLEIISYKIAITDYKLME